MSLKVKLISCISLFMLMIGVLIIGVFAATQQQLTMDGSVSFVVPDKSLYVKDVRIKQDMASEPESIDSFMPGYINGEFSLDLTGITDTNTYGSFTLYFDIINTTDSYWQITDVDLGTLEGVSEEHGGIVRVNELIDTDDDGYKNFDPSTPIDGTLTLTIIAPNADADNPVVLDDIVITINVFTPPMVETLVVGQTATGEMLGTAESGGYAMVGEEVTLHAGFTGNADADFLGWKLSEDDTEFVSTLPDYTFTFTEESATTYVAIFEEPNEYLTYTYNTPTSGEARLRRCSVGAVEITVPSKICRSSTLYTVTSMYDTHSFNGGVFYQTRSTLQSVSLPDTITNIGGSAFYGCSNLESITIPEGVARIEYGAFNGCSGLTSLIIPSSVTIIEDFAFAYCSGLTGELLISKDVTSIGRLAFAGCVGFETITVEEENKTYHSNGNCLIETASGTLLQGCNNSEIPIDGSVTSIGDYAFYDCSELTDITIPEGVRSIGDTAFRNCSGFTDIIIPKGVKSIGGSAFYGCSNLESITIPEGVTSIGDFAFRDCSNLKSITIPTSVTSIDSGVFQNCSSLESVIIPEGVKSIGDYAFCDCSNLKSITIPERVTSIGNNAFSKCSSLTSITIPTSVTSIGGRAFEGCDSLKYNVDKEGVSYLGNNNTPYIYLVDAPTTITNYTIKDTCIAIGYSAFSGCRNLTSITILEGVTIIDDVAFFTCSSLRSITIPDSVTNIGGQAFDGCSGLETVTINEYIYTSVKSQSSCGRILQIAATVYVPQAVVENDTITMGSYLSSKFTQGELVDGYYVFTRNA